VGVPVYKKAQSVSDCAFLRLSVLK
jgi:hypothetical protein